MSWTCVRLYFHCSLYFSSWVGKVPFLAVGGEGKRKGLGIKRGLILGHIGEESGGERLSFARSWQDHPSLGFFLFGLFLVLACIVSC